MSSPDPSKGLASRRCDGYDVYAVDEGLLPWFGTFLATEARNKAAQSRAEGFRLLFRVERDGRPLIMKLEVFRGTIETSLRRWRWGSRARNLFHAVRKAMDQGVRFTPEVLLTAERFRADLRWEQWILMEFVDDARSIVPAELTAERQSQVQQALRNAHRFGLASGDPKPGNFLVTGDETLLIDLDGRPATPLARAVDQVRCEQWLGQPFPPHGPWYHFARFYCRLLQWRRRLVKTLKHGMFRPADPSSAGDPPPGTSRKPSASPTDSPKP